MPRLQASACPAEERGRLPWRWATNLGLPLCRELGGMGNHPEQGANPLGPKRLVSPGTGEMQLPGTEPQVPPGPPRHRPRRRTALPPAYAGAQAQPVSAHAAGY